MKKTNKLTNFDFIKKANTIHDNKYDYSKVEFNSVRDKVKIICPIHGEFEQEVRVHLRGSGCKKCKQDGKRIGVDLFINRANAIHKNKYDYSKVEFKNIKDKIKIICPIHGEFEQSADAHQAGKNCYKCSKNNKLTTVEFINKANAIHNNKYDYSLVDYVNNSTNVSIICPIHGEFKQRPANHLNGKGCRKCGFDSISDTIIDFVNKSKSVHNDKYDYSKVFYKNSRIKVKIICPIHGKFEQTPDSHVQGCGCLSCSHDITRKTNDFFINEIKEIYGDNYDYSLVNYINYDTKIKLICPTHGEFEIAPKHLLNGQSCKRCNSSALKQEKEIVDFIKTLNLNYKENERTILNGKELDIYIPTKKIAFEYDGLYWHNELNVDKNYHLNKTEICETKNIQLIHIFEDEWLHKQDIVKSRIKNILGLTENKIYARKTEIKLVDTKKAYVFLEENHIQGNVKSSVKLGLYYNNELVSIMCFNKPRLGIGKKYDGYELSRFCSKLNTNVIGGADKLLQHFIKTYNPKTIISYADRRWSNGVLYEKLGFNKVKINKPNYWYVTYNKRKHRFNFRKDILAKKGFSIENKTEHQIMLDRGIYRIYDCGTITYKLELY